MMNAVVEKHLGCWGFTPFLPHLGIKAPRYAKAVYVDCFGEASFFGVGEEEELNKQE